MFWLLFRRGSKRGFPRPAEFLLPERRRRRTERGASRGFVVPRRTTMTTHSGSFDDDHPGPGLGTGLANGTGDADTDDPQPGSRVSLIPTTQPGPALGARLQSWLASPGGLAVTAEVRVDPAAVDLLAAASVWANFRT